MGGLRIAGSPPQVRGKLFCTHPFSVYNGITPAGAGKTTSNCSESGNRQDHPRRCGENKPSSIALCVGLGSPPQVRGKPCACNTSTLTLGITPAGAGKTGTCCRYRAAKQDHPRRCGENSLFMQNVFSFKGSPPQVRGKRPEFAFRHGQFADHPRRCGENHGALRAGLYPKGSPPQVRGKQLNMLIGILAARITPAGAGKTSPRKREHVQTQDHPRRCGENVYDDNCAVLEEGSPPQVRGKHIDKIDKLLADGITPAGAGKTFLTATRAIGI